jgi:hypothetical protein
LRTIPPTEATRIDDNDAPSNRKQFQHLTTSKLLLEIRGLLFIQYCSKDRPVRLQPVPGDEHISSLAPAFPR